MIITKLIGGLGNQMFQYAAGRRAAYFNNTVLKLDTSSFTERNINIKREYGLFVFNLQELIASNHEVNFFLKNKNIILKYIKKNKLKIILRKIFNKNYYKENGFNFNKSILYIPNNSFLDGYWQSENYFKDIEGLIRQDFTFKYKPNKFNTNLLNNITNNNSVSIHIRRGDYAYNLETNEYHGLCSIKYYKKAIEIIQREVKDPIFFIFSDDPSWAIENFKLANSFYITKNLGKKDFEDLRLMSTCKHNIIANSSFSWWGAWLNNYENKIVIAPKKWFTSQKFNLSDRLPSTWVKI